MKILFLSGWYPSRIKHQLGNFVQKHAEAVALTSEVAALFVISDIDCKSRYEFEQSTINNVFTVIVYYKKVTHKIPLLSHGQRAWRYLRAHFIGWRIVKERFGKIDLIHHNILYPAGVFALLLNRLYGYTYIITEHATEYLPFNHDRFSVVRKIASHYIIKSAFCITTVSENLRKAMVNRGLYSDYRIVYNVADTHLFVPHNKSNIKFRFLHVSTLNDKHKNISGMLRTIARLSRQRSDLEFWFIGEGDPAYAIELAKKLDIYNTVVFFDGPKTTFEIAEIMSNADCFFMFSNYENLPCVIVEALACGLPVLSSDVGGIHEHINDGNGILIPAGNEDALLAAFNTMIHNLQENKYNAETLRDYAVKNFSYEAVGNAFHHIYSEALHDDV